MPKGFVRSKKYILIKKAAENHFFAALIHLISIFYNINFNNFLLVIAYRIWDVNKQGRFPMLFPIHKRNHS